MSLDLSSSSTLKLLRLAADGVVLPVCRGGRQAAARPAVPAAGRGREAALRFMAAAAIFTARYCLWLWALHLVCYLTPASKQVTYFSLHDLLLLFPGILWPGCLRISSEHLSRVFSNSLCLASPDSRYLEILVSGTTRTSLTPYTSHTRSRKT